jgi:putative endonuclease
VLLRWIGRKADALRHRGWLLRGNVAHAWGKRGEDLAHRYLQAQGLIVIGRNYRTRSGTAEVDLIVADGDTIVFVEVKTRATDKFGAPDEAVDREKRRHIVRAATEYLRRIDKDFGCARFDIVNVLFGEAERVEHLRDAFKPEYHYGIAKSVDAGAR